MKLKLNKKSRLILISTGSIALIAFLIGTNYASRRVYRVENNNYYNIEKLSNFYSAYWTKQNEILSVNYTNKDVSTWLKSYNFFLDVFKNEITPKEFNDIVHAQDKNTINRLNDIKNNALNVMKNMGSIKKDTKYWPYIDRSSWLIYSLDYNKYAFSTLGKTLYLISSFVSCFSVFSSMLLFEDYCSSNKEEKTKKKRFLILLILVISSIILVAVSLLRFSYKFGDWYQFTRGNDVLDSIGISFIVLTIILLPLLLFNTVEIIKSLKKKKMNKKETQNVSTIK